MPKLMMKDMPDALKVEVKTSKDAVRFLKDLWNSDFRFHIDDDPADVPTFSKEVADHLNSQIEKCQKRLPSKAKAINSRLWKHFYQSE